MKGGRRDNLPSLRAREVGGCVVWARVVVIEEVLQDGSLFRKRYGGSAARVLGSRK